MEIKCQAKSFNCIILYILYVFQPCEHRHRPMLVISWSGELRPILAYERLSLYPVMMPSTCYQLTYIPTSFVASVPTLESVAGIKFRIGIYYKNQWCWLSRYEATLKRAVKIVEWCNHHKFIKKKKKVICISQMRDQCWVGKCLVQSVALCCWDTFLFI